MVCPRMRLAAHGHAFGSLAEVMAKANEEKSGDRLAGVAAADARERVAAKGVLAGLPLRTFVEEPLLPPERDELTRAFLDALDHDAYAGIAGWTVGELREHLLADSPESLATLRPGLLPQMVAAVARAARPAPGTRVRGLARDARTHGRRPADRPGRRPAPARMTFDFERARRATPAQLGIGRAGVRLPTAAWLAFQADHAAARDAVWSEWSAAFQDRLRAQGFLLAASAAPDRLAYIREPPLGRRLAAGDLERIRAASPRDPAIQLVVSDGLSAGAAEAHLEQLWPPLCERLARLGPFGTPVAVRNGRVAVADVIASAAGARLVVHLIGERPGLASPDSLGCYVTLDAGQQSTDADRKCISNIRPAGLDPAEAGATIAGLCRRILEHGSSGTDLVL